MGRLYIFKKMWPFKSREKQTESKLLVILELTKSLVEKSDESPYAGFSPEEITVDLVNAIISIERGEHVDKDQLRMHFGPTGSLQETAMDAGWGDDYLKLAEMFDRAINTA